MIKLHYLLKWSSFDRRNTYYVWTDSGNWESVTNISLSMLDLSTLQAATENFAEGNKLGEGGFGAVYKVLINCTIVVLPFVACGKFICFWMCMCIL
jgi:hypothetical protein